MVKVTDFAIIQRDENNEARVYFSGKIPSWVEETACLWARVYSEDENLTVCDHTLCQRENDEWKIDG